MTPVQEKLNQFQKEMWSHERPLMFAVEIVLVCRKTGARFE